MKREVGWRDEGSANSRNIVNEMYSTCQEGKCGWYVTSIVRYHHHHHSSSWSSVIISYVSSTPKEIPSLELARGKGTWNFPLMLFESISQQTIMILCTTSSSLMGTTWRKSFGRCGFSFVEYSRYSTSIQHFRLFHNQIPWIFLRMHGNFKVKHAAYCWPSVHSVRILYGQLSYSGSTSSTHLWASIFLFHKIEDLVVFHHQFIKFLPSNLDLEFNTIWMQLYHPISS